MSELEGTPQPIEIPLSESTLVRKVQAKDAKEEIAAPNTGASKIRTFEQKLSSGRHEDNWTRTPNSPGTGAIHVKSFHCKFSEESLAHVDQQINEWLDAHPQYEVKLVTTSHGEWKGKFGAEPCLVVQVWV